VARHEGHDRRRVEPPGEEGAERNVAHHLHAHGVVEALGELGDVARARRAARRTRLAVGRRPVAPLGELARAPRRRAPGRELADAAEERARTRHVAIRKVVPDGREVHLGTRAGQRQQRLDLGSEVQVLALLQQEERLLAEAVAREEEHAAARVPDGEGEHAAQALHHALAPVLPGAQQHLGVRGRREGVARSLELGAQLAEVVDLAVERERQARRRVAHRLVAAARIDDGEAAVPQQDAAARAGVDLAGPVAVGAAVRDRLEHALEMLDGERAALAHDGSGDSAHG
jgi:hypothetical protein